MTLPMLVLFFFYPLCVFECGERLLHKQVKFFASHFFFGLQAPTISTSYYTPVEQSQFDSRSDQSHRCRLGSRSFVGVASVICVMALGNGFVDF